jgi:AbrB family looped-hinge helix DNA binding protein
VPKKARDKFELNEGDLLMFIEENGRLYLARGTDL